LSIAVFIKAKVKNFV